MGAGASGGKPGEINLWCCAPQDGDAGTEIQTGLGFYTGSEREGGSSQAKAKAAPKAKSAAPAAPALVATAEADAGGSMDLVLSDLAAAEEFQYGQAFAGMDLLGSGVVAMDNPQLRSFVKANTAIDDAELDTELVKIVSWDEGGIKHENFLKLLRENAIADTMAIEEFLGASSDGASLPAPDCRRKLQEIGLRKLNATFSQAQWDRVCNTVMMAADGVVSLEDWISYCNQVARIVRVSKLSGR